MSIIQLSENGFEYSDLPLDGSGFSDAFKAAIKRIGGSIFLNEVWLPARLSPPFNPAKIWERVASRKPIAARVAWYAYKPLPRWCGDYTELE
jgi:hypothetical protein